jgi:2-dehydro-3-deoxyphosphogluconate aldolase / (4S)-4-hydroxy-2-oxoglutarate aldolase
VNPILKKIGLTGIVPVVAIEDANNAVPLARALMDGGIPCIEITFRTTAAKDAMRQISAAVPDMLMGAGTVLTVDQVKTAVDCGAKYIVSPGLNRKVVEYCLAQNIPVTPGVATPSEVEVAIELGLEVAKFFPAEAMGGLGYLNAIGAPYKAMKFIPTGGIDEGLLLSYLKSPRVHAIGGSWMVKSDMIAAGKFDEIKSLSAKAVASMLGLHIAHVGINAGSPEDASRLAVFAGGLLNAATRETSAAFFAGSQVEFRKNQSPGTHGHLAIGTHFIERAIAHFERSGFKLLPDTMIEKNGKPHAVYLDVDVAGFAVHLIQA